MMQKYVTKDKMEREHERKGERKNKMEREHERKDDREERETEEVRQIE